MQIYLYWGAVKKTLIFLADMSARGDGGQTPAKKK